MSEVLTPVDEGETAALVGEAAKRGQRLTVRGGGTRSGLGRPDPSDAAVLSTEGLDGITLFEPSELVISAKAGTPLSTLESALAEKRLMLPFEPMDHRTLYGTDGEPTVGAVAACNVSGPRRLSVGAARDHLIGVRLVNGRGEIVKSGGRVMKNVTGLDLVKLNAGAHGMLGVLTEVTFKLLPVPEHRATVLFEGLSAAEAVVAMSKAMTLPLDVAAAAHLPAGTGDGPARTLLRLEGFTESVSYRIARLAEELSDLGTHAVIGGDEGDALWRAIRDVRFLAGPEYEIVLRVHLPPSRTPEFLRELEPTGLHFFADWAGGLVWLGLPAGADFSHWRNRARGFGGHTTMVRAPADLRSQEAVFEPLGEAVMRLTEGTKAAFDPQKIINFGRMYSGV